MKVGGKKVSVLGASRRIDSTRFREATGWAPQHPDAKVGLKAVAAAHQAAPEPGGHLVDDEVEAVEAVLALAEGEVGDDDLVEADRLPLGDGLGDVVGQCRRPRAAVSSRKALAFAASSVTRKSAWAERLISLGSRPMRSQCCVEHRAALGDGVGEAPHVPLVGVAGDDAEHPVALATDQQRQRVLHGLRLTDGVGELVVAAVDRGRLLAEEAVPHLARLLEAREQLAGSREIDAVLLVLVDLPTGADAEQQRGRR